MQHIDELISSYWRKYIPNKEDGIFKKMKFLVLLADGYYF